MNLATLVALATYNCHWLIMGKVEIGIAVSLQIFWQMFYRNIPWVVLYLTCEYCQNRWIHELLKSKLFSYGISGKTLKWIDSFLCFRQQRVVVNLTGLRFCWLSPRAPFLFSLYVKDISSDIESEIRLFADDCAYYCEIKDEEDTITLQRDIDQLGSWARKWGMRFQPVKCNMMQLTRKQIKKIHASNTLEGTDLENVERIKYLGVTTARD